MLCLDQFAVYTMAVGTYTTMGRNSCGIAWFFSASSSFFVLTFHSWIGPEVSFGSPLRGLFCESLSILLQHLKAQQGSCKCLKMHPSAAVSLGLPDTLLV